MPKYALFFTYTSEAWDAMVENPRDRAAQARAVVEAVDGTMEAIYWMFGPHDGVCIFDAANPNQRGSGERCRGQHGVLQASRNPRAAHLRATDRVVGDRSRVQAAVSAAGAAGDRVVGAHEQWLARTPRRSAEAWRIAPAIARGRARVEGACPEARRARSRQRDRPQPVAPRTCSPAPREAVA
jgi:GYD domain